MREEEALNLAALVGTTDRVSMTGDDDMLCHIIGGYMDGADFVYAVACPAFGLQKFTANGLRFQPRPDSLPFTLRLRPQHITFVVVGKVSPSMLSDVEFPHEAIDILPIPFGDEASARKEAEARWGKEPVQCWTCTT